MEYKVISKSTPSFDKQNQILSIRTEMEGIIEKVAIEQIRFKDECVGNALIALGWTPPPSSPNSKFERVTLENVLRSTSDGMPAFRKCMEHETLMSFWDDDGNYAFVDWWEKEGAMLFNAYYKNKIRSN